MNTSHTFYEAITRSVIWQAWVRQNELYPEHDVHEAMELGMMSPKHFDAFMRYAAEQYELCRKLSGDKRCLAVTND